MPDSVKYLLEIREVVEQIALMLHWFLYDDSTTEGLPHCAHHHHHLALNREGRLGTTDDITTSFFHFPYSPLSSKT